MSLHRRLRDRLRPWYALDAVVFLFGVGGALWRRTSGSLGERAALDPFTGVVAVVYGLLALVVFRFTVGNLWAYAVEYVDAGGQWTDLPFLLPVVGGAGAGAVAFGATTNLGAAAWAGFWTFAFLAGVVAVAVSFLAGYRDVSA